MAAQFHRVRHLLLLGVSGLALTSCGGTVVSASRATTATPSATSSPSASASVKPARGDASAVVNALVAQIKTVSVSVVYTASTDPNHLLGRPGGYTSKAAFTDSRLTPSDVQDSAVGAVDLGGGIEVYPDNSAALARGQYIQRAEAATGFLSHEYDFTSGGVLLRLAAGFTPSDGQPFEVALAQITGWPSSPV